MNIIYFIENYILGFIILISILVFVHEFGHYAFAKLFGVRVESFSIGFGRELIGWNDKSGTRWKISLLPLGGYVKMKGEMVYNPNEKIEEDSFLSKKLWQRALIVFAGPLFNLIFPIIILVFITFLSGVPNLLPKIGGVLPSSPSSGVLKENDLILEVNNIKINNFKELSNIINKIPNQNISLKINREDKIMNLSLTTGKNDSGLGFLGIMADQKSISFIKYSIYDSLFHAYDMYKNVFTLLLSGLQKLFMGDVALDDLGGPLKIAQMSGDSLNQGLYSWLFFMSILSLNLAIINLFPIPALDGGHLLTYLVEGIIRRPLNPKIHNFLMQIGFFFLMSLMLIVIINDIWSFAKKWIN